MAVLTWHTGIGTGLGALGLPMDGSSYAAIALFVKAGSRCEESGLEGVAHLVEHLIFRETRRLLAPGGELARCGAWVSAHTARDYVCYFGVTRPEHVATLLDGLATLVFAPTFAAEDLIAEKAVIFNEMTETSTDAMARAVEAVWRRISGRSLSPIGSAADLQRATVDAVRAFHRRWYTPANAAVCVGGNFDWDEVLEWAERISLTSPSDPRPPTGYHPPCPAGLSGGAPGLSEPIAVAVVPGVPPGHPDFAAEAVVRQMLTDRRLPFVQALELGGVATSLLVAPQATAAWTGCFVIVGYDAELRGEVGPGIQAAFRALEGEGCPAGLLEGLEEQVAVAHLQLTASPLDRVLSLGEQFTLYGQVHDPHELALAVEQLRTADVAAYLARAPFPHRRFMSSPREPAAEVGPSACGSFLVGLKIRCGQGVPWHRLHHP